MAKDMPRAGGKREVKITPGPKPKNKDILITDAKGTVDWERTQKDFPVKKRR